MKNSVEIDDSPFSGEEAVKAEAFEQYRAGNVTLSDLEEWFGPEMGERARSLKGLAEVVEAESGEESDLTSVSCSSTTRETPRMTSLCT